MTLIMAQAAKHQAQASAAVQAAVANAAQKTGVDFSYLMEKAAEESGFNPAAKAHTSSATGLFQFIDSTWLQMVKTHGAEYGLGKEAAAITTNPGGSLSVSDPAMKKHILELRKDPNVSAALAAEFTKDNAEVLKTQAGGTIGSTELSMAHFMGAQGAAKFLTALHSNPAQTAASVNPAAAAANRPIFYDKHGHAKSVAEVYARFASSTAKSAVYGDPAYTAISSPDALPRTAGVSGSTGSGGSVSLANVTAGTRQTAYTTMMLAQLGVPLEGDVAPNAAANHNTAPVGVLGVPNIY